MKYAEVKNKQEHNNFTNEDMEDADTSEEITALSLKDTEGLEDPSCTECTAVKETRRKNYKTTNKKPKLNSQGTEKSTQNKVPILQTVI